MKILNVKTIGIILVMAVPIISGCSGDIARKYTLENILMGAVVGIAIGGFFSVLGRVVFGSKDRSTSESNRKNTERMQEQPSDKIIEKPEDANAITNAEHSKSDQIEAKTQREEMIIEKLTKELGRKPTPEEFERAKWTY